MVKLCEAPDALVTFPNVFVHLVAKEEFFSSKSPRLTDMWDPMWDPMWDSVGDVGPVTGGASLQSMVL